MQTAVFKNIQIADDQQQRHMLKIGVRKRTVSGLRRLGFTRRAACWKPERTDSGYRMCRCQCWSAFLYQAGASFRLLAQKSSKLSMISVQGRVLVLRCANSYACACKNSMNACNRCSAIAKNWQRPWPRGRDGRSTGHICG